MCSTIASRRMCREPLDQAAHAQRQLGPFQAAPTATREPSRRPGGRRRLLRPPPVRPPVARQHAPTRDVEQPDPERAALPAEPIQALERVDEHFLRQVLGGFRVAGAPFQVGEKVIMVPLEERPERVGVDPDELEPSLLQLETLGGQRRCAAVRPGPGLRAPAGARATIYKGHSKPFRVHPSAFLCKNLFAVSRIPLYHMRGPVCSRRSGNKLAYS